MKTIMVDDERWAIQRFEMECASIADVELVGTFCCAADALEYAKSNRVDAAFLDVEMPGMTGLELTEHLRKLYPGMVIIIVSAHDGYVADAVLKKKVDGFVLKPYSTVDVEDALVRARLLAARLKRRVYIHTFGRFQVYLDGKPIVFTSPKAKEILAYIVMKNRDTATNDEIYVAVWGDQRPDSHQDRTVLYNALRKLRQTLERAGIPNLLVSVKGEHKINRELCDCDYYQILDHEVDAYARFTGQLLSEYSWAEAQLAELIFMQKELE